MPYEVIVDIPTHLFHIVMNQSNSPNDRLVVIFVLFATALHKGCKHATYGCNDGDDDAVVHGSPKPATQDIADVPRLALQLPRPSQPRGYLAQELQSRPPSTIWLGCNGDGTPIDTQRNINGKTPPMIASPWGSHRCA
jgi:hypothetical protein